MNSDSNAIDAESEEVILVTLDDPEWQDALYRFQGYRLVNGRWDYFGNSDPKPLAMLLRSGQNIPEIVALTIAQMLDSNEEWVGGKISVGFPRRKDVNYTRNRLIMLQYIITTYEKSQLENWGYESFISKVQEKYNLSRSRIADLARLKHEDLILEIHKKFGID